MAGVCAILLLGGVTVWELQQRETPAPAPPPKKQLVTIPVDPPRQRVGAVAKLEHPIVPPELPLLQATPPREPQLFEIEVEVWWLLHRAGVCNGEPVEIRTTNDRIVISGIVPTRRRRKELAAALEGISDRDFIRVELEAVEDIPPLTGATLLAPLPVLHSGPPTEASEFQIAAAMVLRGLYPNDAPADTRKRLVEISNLAIRRSEDSVGEALAIRRLGDRFRDDSNPNLSAQSRQWLETMAREHLLALRSHLTEIDNLLAPILSNMSSQQVVAVPSLDLSAAVERLRILVQGSLLGNSPSLRSPTDISREIAAQSEFLSTDLSDIDSAVVRVFSRASTSPGGPSPTTRHPLNHDQR